MFSQKETFHIFLAYKTWYSDYVKKTNLQLNNKKINYTILKNK